MSDFRGGLNLSTQHFILKKRWSVLRWVKDIIEGSLRQRKRVVRSLEARKALKAIGRAFGKPSSSIYFLVAPQGGIRPAQRRRSRMARMTYLGPRRFDRQGF